MKYTCNKIILMYTPHFYDIENEIKFDLLFCTWFGPLRFKNCKKIYVVYFVFFYNLLVGLIVNYSNLAFLTLSELIPYTFKCRSHTKTRNCSWRIWLFFKLLFYLLNFFCDGTTESSYHSDLQCRVMPLRSMINYEPIWNTKS